MRMIGKVVVVCVGLNGREPFRGQAGQAGQGGVSSN